MADDATESSQFRNEEFEMDEPSFYRACAGITGMAFGAAVVTLIRVAAVDGAESARLQHLADIASGRTPTPRVVVRSDMHCPAVAETDARRFD
jgi:hypothetical protein